MHRSILMTVLLAVLLGLSQYAAIAEVSPLFPLGGRRGWLLPLVGTSGVILFLAAPIVLREVKVQCAFWCVVSLASGLLVLTDVLYFRQFRELPQVAAMEYAGQLGQVGSSVLPLMKARDAILLLPSVMVLLALLRWRSMRDIGVRLGRAPLPTGLALAAAGLAAVSFSVYMSPSKMGWMGPRALAGSAGFLAYHLSDASDAIAERLTLNSAGSEEDVDEARLMLANRASNSPAALVDPPPNLIVLMVESLQSFVVDLEVNGEPVAPAISALARRGRFFPNFFPQTRAGNTSDAEFVSYCSQYASKGGASFYAYSNKKPQCLPRLLALQAYNTVAYHANSAGMWNRAKMYPTIGFANFRHKDMFPAQPRIGLGLSDMEFLASVADSLEAQQEPFFAHVLTLTSHSPFRDPNLPTSLDVGTLRGSRVGDYLSAIHFTDAAVGSFVERLERTGILGRTVLVLLGDHEGVRRSNSNLASVLDDQLKEPEASLRELRVPLILLGPGIEAFTETRPFGQIDLAPTLASFLGVPFNGFLGRDMFDQAVQPMVNVRDEVFVSEDRIFIGPHFCFTSIGNRLPEDSCADLIHSARQESRASGVIMDVDLMRPMDG